VLDSEDDDAAVEDALVRFYSEDGTALLYEGVSDADGVVELLVEEGVTYHVRGHKVRYSFHPRTAITPTEAGSWDLAARNLNAPSPATDANMCRASGQLIDGSGIPLASVPMVFRPIFPRRFGGSLVAGPARGVSSAAGVLAVQLIRGGVYDVSEGETCRKVLVPSTAWCDLSALIYPQAKSMTWDVDNEASPAVTLAAGDTIEMYLTVQLTSRVAVPFTWPDTQVPEGLGQWITVEVADEEDGFVEGVATFVLYDNRLSVHGLAAGTTVVRATPLRRDDQDLPVAAGFPSLLSITVT
jgi:hypothetical protein